MLLLADLIKEAIAGSVEVMVLLLDRRSHRGRQHRGFASAADDLGRRRMQAALDLTGPFSRSSCGRGSDVVAFGLSDIFGNDKRG